MEKIANLHTDRYTTIPNHPGDMPEGTLPAVLKQAGGCVFGSVILTLFCSLDGAAYLDDYLVGEY